MVGEFAEEAEFAVEPELAEQFEEAEVLVVTAETWHCEEIYVSLPLHFFFRLLGSSSTVFISSCSSARCCSNSFNRFAQQS